MLGIWKTSLHYLNDFRELSCRLHLQTNFRKERLLSSPGKTEKLQFDPRDGVTSPERVTEATELARYTLKLQL